MIMMRSSVAYGQRRVFSNIQNRRIEFLDVIDQIVKFINEAPDYHYRLSIGSDSQTCGKKTLLVTVIHVHRVGRGAIGFFTYTRLTYPFNSLRDKIFRETIATMEVAYLFSSDIMTLLLKPFFNHKDGDINFEFHLDIGNKGATRDLINEMIAIAKATPFEPRIKPESYAASSYANRHTKKGFRRMKTKKEQ